MEDKSDDLWRFTMAEGSYQPPEMKRIVINCFLEGESTAKKEPERKIEKFPKLSRENHLIVSESLSNEGKKLFARFCQDFDD
jgi:hypothetical protein